MNHRLLSAVLAGIFLLSSCEYIGALKPKFYPENQSIVTSLIPSAPNLPKGQEFEQKLAQLMRESQSGQNESTNILPVPGKILVLNTVSTLDSEILDDIKRVLLENPKATAVEVSTLQKLPKLRTLRYMGARQGAKYVLLLNAFSNAYQYYNEWTIPTIMGLGIPIFFFNTQTIVHFTKVEAALIDIEENIILLNEAATAQAEGTSTLPKSGVLKYQKKIEAVQAGTVSLLGKVKRRMNP